MLKSPYHLKKVSIPWRKILGESKFINYLYALYLLIKIVIKKFKDRNLIDFLCSLTPQVSKIV